MKSKGVMDTVFVIGQRFATIPEDSNTVEEFCEAEL